MFVDVRLLGPLQVLDRSGQTIEISGELPKALLAVLALEAPASVSSDRIVALAALAGDLSIACQYVGTLPTAKGYGSLPLYALHQKV
jgi:hypothetical protein